MPDAQANAAAGETAGKTDRPAAVKSFSLRTWQLVLAYLAVGFVGLAVFVFRAPQNIGLLAAPVALFAFAQMYFELRGVRVGVQDCAWPTGRDRSFPYFSFGRRKVALESISEISVSRGQAGMEMILVEGDFGGDFVLFSSRAARVRFCDAIKQRAPRVRIYRFTT